MQKTITSHGVDFEVEYNATQYRAATYWEPAEGGEVEIESIFISDQDVWEILPEKVVSDIQQQLEGGLESDAAEARAQAAEDRAEARYEEMMLREAA